MFLKQFVDKTLIAQKYSLKFFLSFDTNIWNDLENAMIFYHQLLGLLPHKVTLSITKENDVTKLWGKSSEPEAVKAWKRLNEIKLGNTKFRDVLLYTSRTR